MLDRPWPEKVTSRDFVLHFCASFPVNDEQSLHKDVMRGIDAAKVRVNSKQEER